MQLTATFVSLLLATGAIAGKNGGNSIKSQCGQIEKLTQMSELASNDTRLAEKFDGNQTRIDAFKAKAAEATTKLTALNANTTLAQECPAVFAHEVDVKSCRTISRFEEMTNLAGNDTKLTEHFEGNTTEIDAFKAKVAEKSTQVTALQGNATLTAFCSVQADTESCKDMRQLQKTVDLSKNATALEAKFEGNATKADRFQQKAIKAQAKLDAMMGNATLTAFCGSLPQAATDGQTTNRAGTSSDSKSFGVKTPMSGTLAIALMVAAAGWLAIM